MRPFRSRPKAGSRGDPSDPLARNQRNDTSRIFSQLVDRSVSASTQATTTLTAPDTKYLPSRPATRHEFEIAIICALTLEADAVAALFDQHWDYNGPPYDKAPGDPNAYTTGAIGRHNVVLVHMPGMGKANAAAGAANCRASFPNIKLAAVVGICGAVPFGPDGSEIVLGDVIISDGVVQYDLGRRHPDRFVRKDTLSDSLGRPTAEIRALLSKLKSRHDRSTLQDKLAMHLKVIQDNPELEAQYPGAANDRLLEATYHHTSEGSLCNESGCSGPLVLRRRLEQENTQPIVHFGLIASGDTVMRSGEERDSIAQRERVLGFEMEGAGVWDSFPCIVIKGVCDYADSHKAKSWQRYAGATAAACLKAFLEFWIPSLSSVQEPYSVAKQPTGMWLPERPETPPQPSFMVPFSHDTNFIERRYLLNRIHQACLEPASRTALVGLGGNGKSQLAIEYTYRVRDAFKKQNKQIWVFWVHAGTRARVEEGFKTIADAIKLPERNQPQADILQLVYQWLRDERNGQWLMVLDSADNIDVFYDTDEKSDQKATEGEKRALWTYLPQSANGSILVTTRNKDLASRLTVSYRDIIEVGPMDQDQAFRLLAMKLGSQYDKDDGKKLVEALEYIPLAISQAAAYIQKRAPRTSVKKYLEEFRESERKQSSLLNYDNGDLRRDRDASNSVINTWQISFDYIRSKRPSATELLSFMSFFDCQGILESLIRPIYRENNTDDEDSVDDEELTDNESISSHEVMNNEFEDDITMLRDYCLVGTNEKGDVFEMHGLVQLSTRKWLDVYGETERFKVQYISRMAQAFPPGDFQNWRTCQKLFPHAERAILHRPVDEKSLEEWALLLFNGSRRTRPGKQYWDQTIQVR
ncbi:hypothetical protein GQX73_g9228 [Xylaria multiplex]|uniref:Nucleoside phosphorylase domain-containing protein n=1 Tax=Xylaria multiplex TaxID=323545 RepID=A0A7C8IN38_9PEZI|nr:hypothetical protein GQX73_g9228 [Xylaria multiplex]